MRIELELMRLLLLCRLCACASSDDWLWYWCWACFAQELLQSQRVAMTTFFGVENEIRRFKVEDNVQERMERIVCAYVCVVCVRCVLIAHECGCL